MAPITRLLVANRGEIAVRIVRAAFDEGIETVVATSQADRDSLAAKLADRSVVIGPAAAGTPWGGNASETWAMGGATLFRPASAEQGKAGAWPAGQAGRRPRM